MVDKKKVAIGWIKAIAYRIYVSFFISPLILFVMTGDVKLSLSFGVVEFLVKIPAYYFFEWLWSKISKS